MPANCLVITTTGYWYRMKVIINSTRKGVKQNKMGNEKGKKRKPEKIERRENERNIKPSIAH